jgi:Zn-dependent peptidase ImmA (M78 family)
MIGSRLKLAREAAGWSLRELESEIDCLVTAQAIGKYERDEMMPSSKVLLKLASALSVTPEYLLSENEIKLEEVDFRRAPVEGAKDGRSMDARVLDEVDRYLALEAAVPGETIIWHRPSASEFILSCVEDAEHAANRLRMNWRLGIEPIASVTELLEGQGIKVISIPLPTHVSGSKAFARQSHGEPIPMIVVNSQHNGERQRFTLAHELGHLVIDWKGASAKEHEKAADWFAGAFLVCKDMVERVIGRSRTAITLGELIAVKRVFKVSLAALAMRLKQLGIITKSTFGQVWAILTRNGWTVPGAVEPEPIVAEHPSRAKRLALRALAEGAISESKAAELLSIRRRELNEMLEFQPA